ncbi:MAG: hypothetical protein LBL81_00885, partial [Tannerella sp.]|nr:hypothetical protein [Tannerella sp.]
MHDRLSLIIVAILLSLCACGQLPEATSHTDRQPRIFPDYAGATFPPNIAPPDFALRDSAGAAWAVFSAKGKQWSVQARDGQFRLPRRAWKKMAARAAGDSIVVRVLTQQGGWLAYAPFYFHIAKEPVDPYLAYRLIEPGYELWNRMGIYQRDLENYRQTPILENTQTGKNCMNCHSFCMQDPQRMIFHTRALYAGTMLIDSGRIEKLNTKTPQTISALVYPSWHPSGRYVAFSVNSTKQAFHQNDPNRIEVFDKASDVVVYNLSKHQIS